MRHRLYPKPFLVGCSRKPDGTPLKLYPHPVRDAELFCDHHLREAFDEWGMFLRPADYDESLSLLIIHLWRMEQRFDPERNDSFENFARTYIPKRAVDVGPRRILGRNGNRLNDYLFDELGEETPTGPGSAFTDLEGDQDSDRRREGGRLQDQRDRDRAWAANLLGLGAGEVAA